MTQLTRFAKYHGRRLVHRKLFCHRTFFRLLFCSVLAVVFVVGASTVSAGEKVVIGALEEVILLPWKVRLLARIDTGANTSSMGARGLKIHNNMAHFRLREEYGGKEFKLPIVEWRTFSSSESNELRPVVEIEICLGPRRLRTQVSLNDRSRVDYPFLVGRRVLKEGSFIVDVTRTDRLPPACVERKRN